MATRLGMIEELLARSPYPLNAAEVAACLECDETAAEMALEMLASNGAVFEIDGRYIATRDI